MNRHDVLAEMNTSEWGGFLRYVKDKPPVFGTDSEGQPVNEYAATDVHEYLTLIRGIQHGTPAKLGPQEVNNGSTKPATQAV